MRIVYSRKQNWDIVICGQRIAWVGPQGEWSGNADEIVSVEGWWAVPGFGEPHKHIESTSSARNSMPISYCASEQPGVEASHEFSNIDGARNVEFWFTARKHGSPLKIFPSLGSATPPIGGRSLVDTTVTKRSMTSCVKISESPVSRADSSSDLVNGSICPTGRENPRKSDGDAGTARRSPGLNRRDNRLDRGGLGASFQKR